MRKPEKRPLTLRLLGGLILFVSTLYCGPRSRTGKGRGREGSGLYPELAVLGFSEGSSAALVSRGGRQCAWLPSYEMARRKLARRGPSPGIKVGHRIARTLGAQVLAPRTRDLERWRAGELLPGPELVGKRVGAMIDDGRTRLRRVTRKQKGHGKSKTQRRRYQAPWREPKLLIVFERDDRGRTKADSRAWIDATFGGPDEAMELLAFHRHRLGASRAEVVALVADGAPWVWERLEWVERLGDQPPPERAGTDGEREKCGRGCGSACGGGDGSVGGDDGLGSGGDGRGSSPGVGVPRHACAAEGEDSDQSARGANDGRTRASRGSCMTTFWECTPGRVGRNG